MTSMRALVLNRQTNLSQVKERMQFREKQHGVLSLSSVNLPSVETLDAMQTELSRSSCAVVGANAALLGCRHTADICKHDIVIHVNQHPKLLSLCPRVDIQIINAFVCTTSDCVIKPRLFRLRHEWNPRQIALYSKHAWLATGTEGLYVRDVLTKRIAKGRCCPSAGGIAASFALHACKHTTLYGLGARNVSYVDDANKQASNSVHDFASEFQWYMYMRDYQHVQMRCY
jgi:hypothetical protein